MRNPTRAQLLGRLVARATAAPQSSICGRCLRPISTTSASYSGHNKWSKIRHKKGAADAAKTNMRSQHSKMIALWSKMYGPDAKFNPQLDAAVTTAKKAGIPKSVIESAIARGQGRLADGTSLENMTLEAVIPPGVAMILEVETESKSRSLQDLKLLLKRHGASLSSTTFFFTRLGRVTFEGQNDGLGVDDIMDDAIEAGAEDLETDEEGNIIIWTQPNLTTAVAQAIGAKFQLRLLDSEIIWTPNEDTKIRIESGTDAVGLGDFLVALQEYPEVQNAYANVAKGQISDEEWSTIEENLDI